MFDIANDLLFSAEAEECAKHSFDNYHAPGLCYLNLLRTPRLTAKVYLFEPGKWEPAHGLKVVHPHDHAYSFTTLVLAGEMRNHLYEVDDVGMSRARWRYDSHSKDRFSNPVPCRLDSVRSERYERGSHYHMHWHQIHTISVDPVKATALFLLQGPRRTPTTSCFLPMDAEPPKLDGMYTPMSVDRYRERIETVRKLVWP